MRGKHKQWPSYLRRDQTLYHSIQTKKKLLTVVLLYKVHLISLKGLNVKCIRKGSLILENSIEWWRVIIKFIESFVATCDLCLIFYGSPFIIIRLSPNVMANGQCLSYRLLWEDILWWVWWVPSIQYKICNIRKFDWTFPPNVWANAADLTLLKHPTEALSKFCICQHIFREPRGTFLYKWNLYLRALVASVTNAIKSKETMVEKNRLI